MLCEVSGPFSQPELVLLNLPLSLSLLVCCSWISCQDHSRSVGTSFPPGGSGFSWFFRSALQHPCKALPPFFAAAFFPMLGKYWPGKLRRRQGMGSVSLSFNRYRISRLAKVFVTNNWPPLLCMDRHSSNSKILVLAYLTKGFCSHWPVQHDFVTIFCASWVGLLPTFQAWELPGRMWPNGAMGTAVENSCNSILEFNDRD